jgi:calcium/calmodulin-dependent protein kinase kinase 2
MSAWHNDARTKSKLRLEERRQLQRQRRLKATEAKLMQPVSDIAHGQWRKLSTLVSNVQIQKCSQSYMQVVAKKGNIPTDYGYHAWTISRNYIDDSKVLDSSLSPSFAPLLEAAQSRVEDLLKCQVVIDSACGHLYDADTEGVETGASWAEHRDYASDDSLAYASVVVQGWTPEGFDGGGLTVRVGEEKSFVELASGDALLLRKTWHLPHTITRGRRLVFVLFYRQSTHPHKTQLLEQRETKTTTKMERVESTRTDRTGTDRTGTNRTGTDRTGTDRTETPTRIETTEIIAIHTAGRSTIKTTRLDKGIDDHGKKTFNGYTLLNLVARGAYGKVKHAEKDGHLYAVKIYSKATLERKKRSTLTRSTSSNPMEDVMSEIHILCQLNHVNILHLDEVVNDPLCDKIYLITEWMKGGASMEWNPNTATFHYHDHFFYQESMARTALVQMTLALNHLHQHGIVHHDIKPSNILRQYRSASSREKNNNEEGSVTDKEVRFVLCDFGSACSYNKKGIRIVDTRKGTHAFFAPEMCVGVSESMNSNEVGFSPFVTDVWALGVTLYAYIYGKLPFWDGGLGGQQLFDFILNQEVEVPRWRSNEASLSVGVRELLSHVLHKVPVHRLALHEIMEHSWTRDVASQDDGRMRKEDEEEDEEDIVSF